MYNKPQNVLFQVLLELLTGLPSFDQDREGCDLVSSTVDAVTHLCSLHLMN